MERRRSKGSAAAVPVVAADTAAWTSRVQAAVDDPLHTRPPQRHCVPPPHSSAPPVSPPCTPMLGRAARQLPLHPCRHSYLLPAGQRCCGGQDEIMKK